MKRSPKTTVTPPAPLAAPTYGRPTLSSVVTFVCLAAARKSIQSVPLLQTRASQCHSCRPTRTPVLPQILYLLRPALATSAASPVSAFLYLPSHVHALVRYLCCRTGNGIEAGLVVGQQYSEAGTERLSVPASHSIGRYRRRVWTV